MCLAHYEGHAGNYRQYSTQFVWGKFFYSFVCCGQRHQRLGRWGGAVLLLARSPSSSGASQVLVAMSLFGAHQQASALAQKRLLQSAAGHARIAKPNNPEHLYPSPRARESTRLIEALSFIEKSHLFRKQPTNPYRETRVRGRMSGHERFAYPASLEGFGTLVMGKPPTAKGRKDDDGQELGRRGFRSEEPSRQKGQGAGDWHR